MLVIWYLVLLPFLNPTWTSENSWFTYCWSLPWRILSITLLACEMNTTIWWFEHSLALPFFGIGMKTDLFKPCGHCWDFQIYWYIEGRTLTSSSFKSWSNSAGIPLPPLVLFVVMVPEAHLTSHSRISCSRWVTTPLWSPRSLRPFLHSSSMCYCYLLISSASVRSFLSFFVPIFAWNVPMSSPIFLKKSLVFSILLFSSIFLHCSLKKDFLDPLAILCYYLLLFEETPPFFKKKKL